MEIKILLFSLLFLANSLSFSQTWQPLGTGLYGPPNLVPGVLKLLSDSSNQNLYAAGSFSNAGGVSTTNVARWDGTSWYPMCNNLEFDYTEIKSLIFYRNELYAGSFNDPEHGIGAIGKWTGTQWIVPPFNQIPIDSYYFPVIVYDLEVFNDELYAGGMIMGPNGVSPWGEEDIMRYNGTQWRSLNKGLNGITYALKVYLNELYVGGEFTYADTTIQLNHIAKWNGTQWSNVGGGVSEIILSMEEFNGDLYLGTLGFPNCYIYKWNGIVWDTIAVTDERINTLRAYNGRLYAGGFFKTINGDSIKHIAEWDGTQWNKILNEVDGPVLDIEIFQGNLHVGGRYTQIDTIDASMIARWQLVSGINSVSFNEISVYPNPTDNYLSISGINYQDLLKMYDLLGKEVLSIELNKGTNQVEVKNLTNGIYIYRIPGVSKVGKVLIER